jgi:hypothetical protein
MRAVVTLAALIGTAGAAWAQSTGPVIAIPGRPGVPIIINGVDASYSVVEGDWGLGKGIHIQPTVYNGHPIEPAPPVGHYYPSAGHLPGYGRLEIESAGKPKSAPSFHQSWSAGSRQADPLVPLSPVPPNPPPVITAPQFNEHERERRTQQNYADPQQNSATLQQNSAPPPQNSADPPQNAATPQPNPAPLRAPANPQRQVGNQRSPRHHP